MAKNNRFIYQMKELRKQIDAIVPNVYAVIALALSENGVEAEDIQMLFARSEEIWQNATDNNLNVVADTYDKTGILVVSPYQAKEYGINLEKEGEGND